MHSVLRTHHLQLVTRAVLGRGNHRQPCQQMAAAGKDTIRARPNASVFYKGYFKQFISAVRQEFETHVKPN